jgi:hypothetical protein
MQNNRSYLQWDTEISSTVLIIRKKRIDQYLRVINQHNRN